MAFCTEIPIQTIAGTECIGDSLPKINANFKTLGEKLCVALSEVVSLSSSPAAMVSSPTIDISLPSADSNKVRADLKLESVNFQHLAFEGGPLTYRNKLINGEMMISQRYGTVPVTIDSPTPVYSVDRWYGYADHGYVGTGTFTLEQSGGERGSYSLRAKVITPETVVGIGDSFGIAQKVEGYHIRDFAWGTTDALSACLSFWVKTNLGGKYGGSVRNAAGTRSFAFQYETNTTSWERKVVVIPGDTKEDVVWNLDHNTGLIVNFSLGDAAANLGPIEEWATGNFKGCLGQDHPILRQGAIVSIAGVQLELGNTSTPFETRSYDVELNACKRYYEKSYLATTPPGTVTSQNAYIYEPLAIGGSIDNYIVAPFTVEKRATPGTIACYSPTTGNKNVIAGSSDIATTPSSKTSTKFVAFQPTNPATSLTLGFDYLYHWAVDAEL